MKTRNSKIDRIVFAKNLIDEARERIGLSIQDLVHKASPELESRSEYYKFSEGSDIVDKKLDQAIIYFLVNKIESRFLDEFLCSFHLALSARDGRDVVIRNYIESFTGIVPGYSVPELNSILRAAGYRSLSGKKDE